MESGTWNRAGQAALARHHIGVQLGAPNGYVSSIHVADAAGAAVAALGVPTGTYNVVDDEPLTKRQYTDALARAAGAPVWAPRYPSAREGWLAMAGSAVG